MTSLGYNREPLWMTIAHSYLGEVCMVFHKWGAHGHTLREELVDWFEGKFPHTHFSAEDHTNYCALHFVTPDDQHTTVLFANAGWIPKDANGAIFFFDPSCTKAERKKVDKLLGMDEEIIEQHSIASIIPTYHVGQASSKVLDPCGLYNAGIYAPYNPLHGVKSAKDFLKENPVPDEVSIKSLKLPEAQWGEDVTHKQLDKIQAAIAALESMGKLTAVDAVSLKRLQIARDKMLKAMKLHELQEGIKKTAADFIKANKGPPMQNLGIDMAKAGDSIGAIFNVGMSAIHDSISFSADYSEVEANALTQSILQTIKWTVTQSEVDCTWKVTGTIKFADKKWSCNAHIADAAMEECGDDAVIGVKAGITEQLAPGVSAFVKELAQKAAHENLSAKVEAMKDLIHGHAIGDFHKFTQPISGLSQAEFAAQHKISTPSFAKLKHNDMVALFDEAMNEEAKWLIKPKEPGSDVWIVQVPLQPKKYEINGMDVYDQKGVFMKHLSFDHFHVSTKDTVELQMQVTGTDLLIPPKPVAPKFRELQLIDALGRKKVMSWAIQNPLLPKVYTPKFAKGVTVVEAGTKIDVSAPGSLCFLLDQDTKLSHTPRYFEVRA